MKNRFLTAAIAAALVAPSTALACTKPGDRPAIPDPETAVTAQMVKANNDVKTYVSGMEAYLGCAGLPRSRETAELDELKAFADEFNLAIRTFKAKHGQ